MSLKCGIVGLPNVGKSTLFNALTNSNKAQAENFPFCTIDPNIGIVPLKDERLDKLSEISKSEKKIYTTVTFVDIAGLVEGASKGEGLGNKFLSHIREVDAIIHMIRCFESEKIQNVNKSIDPIRDLEIQKEEDDLVAASFGRGFFIVDDYSPIREFSTDILSKEGYLFSIKDVMQYIVTAPCFSQRTSLINSVGIIHPNMKNLIS